MQVVFIIIHVFARKVYKVERTGVHVVIRDIIQGLGMGTRVDVAVIWNMGYMRSQRYMQLARTIDVTGLIVAKDKHLRLSIRKY